MLVVVLDQRLDLQDDAGELIQPDLPQPDLNGVTAHTTAGRTRRALSHSSQVGRCHPQRSSSAYRSASSSARVTDDATPMICGSAAEPKDA
jgi:hypothetical protein